MVEVVPSSRWMVVLPLFFTMMGAVDADARSRPSSTRTTPVVSFFTSTLPSEQLPMRWYTPSLLMVSVVPLML